MSWISLHYMDTTWPRTTRVLCRLLLPRRPGPQGDRSQSRCSPRIGAGWEPRPPHHSARAYAMKTTDCARAAEMLLHARATRHWLEALPEGARPGTKADAYAIQDMVAHRLGPVVGWKVGSATLHSEPFRAPIHSATLRIENPRLPAEMFHVIGVEAEIVYCFARDLPPRMTPYAQDEVLAAVDSMHPAVEIVDTRFSAFGSVDPLSQRADQQNHGALSVGPALQNWSLVDPVRQPVQLTINGTVRFDGLGENSSRRSRAAPGVDGQPRNPCPRRLARRPGCDDRLLYRDHLCRAGDPHRGCVSGLGRHRTRDLVSLPMRQPGCWRTGPALPAPLQRQREANP